MKTREQIIDENPIVEFMERRGHTFKRSGREMSCLCPLHEDKSPSFRVDPDKGVWTCDPCDIGGSIIDLVMKMDGLDLSGAFQKLGADDEIPLQNGRKHASDAKNGSPQRSAGPIGKIVAEYDYHDEHGRLLFQVCRMEPKTFRQRHKGKGGEWVWGLEDVRRVPYRLPAVIASSMVWIVEGEKDADNLTAKGIIATTNPMGASKWLDAYNEFFRGKEVVLCGDNDEPGRKHVQLLTEKLGEIAKSVRVVKIPAPSKDVSELLETPDAGPALKKAFEAAPVVSGGVLLPIYSMAEMEASYEEFCKESKNRVLSLSCLLPGLLVIRKLVPGELVLVVAGTGVGKTFILQNIAMKAKPLPVLFFEMELPDTLMFERFASMATATKASDVEIAYMEKGRIAWRESGKLEHIHVCTRSRLTPADVQKFIRAAEMKTGIRPAVVMIDYIQLLRGTGNRYERMSDAAEELKVIAKEEKVILFISSQVSRPDGENPEVFLHDAKDSGALENCAGVVLGIWRDEKDSSRMYVKVCKSTKGGAGTKLSARIQHDLTLIQEN